MNREINLISSLPCSWLFMTSLNESHTLGLSVLFSVYWFWTLPKSCFRICITLSHKLFIHFLLFRPFSWILILPCITPVLLKVKWGRAIRNWIEFWCNTILTLVNANKLHFLYSLSTFKFSLFWFHNYFEWLKSDILLLYWIRWSKTCILNALFYCSISEISFFLYIDHN